MAEKQLTVYLHGKPVGNLAQEDSGRLRFQYDPQWITQPDARPLSLSLPLREGPFDDRQTRPFFAGLLPDEAARERLARYFGISRHNDLALLSEVGRECAGAVAVYPMATSPQPADPPGMRFLDDSQLSDLFKTLPKRPLLAGGELRLSLAGAQDKIALVRHGEDFFLPLGDLPTTHILKPSIEHFPHTVINELFCMLLANRLGLNAAEVELGRVRDLSFLIVRRYDRDSREGEEVRRLHQEDFCQALGIPPERKYQHEGGPGLVQCFSVLDACSRPAVERLELLRRIQFNYLIGNADAHGKNFALIHEGPKPTLAPAYDLLSTTVYRDHTDQMAMKIGRKKRFTQVLPRHWKQFATTVGLSPTLAQRELLSMARSLPERAGKLKDDLGTSVSKDEADFIDSMMADMNTRAEHVLAT